MGYKSADTQVYGSALAVKGKEENSSVVITGASRGIGRSIAKAFAAQTNHPLFLIARTESGLRETKHQCEKISKNNIEYIACDAADEEAVEKIRLPESIPGPQFLVNNAGSYLLKTLANSSLQDISKQIRSNLFTAVNITNRFLPVLKKHPKSLIVNICSVGSVEGLGDSGAYSTSKHALLGYTRSLRQELIETSVGVTAINLGQTQSTSWENSDMDRKLLIDPDDIAGLIITLTRFSGRTVAEEILIKPQGGRVPPM